MWCVYSSWLLLLMLCQSHLSAQDGFIYDECDNDYVSFKYFDLYLKLEDSLINYYKSPAVLEELRAVFLNAEVNYITFEVRIQVVNGTNVSCDGAMYPEPPAFCPASSNTSEYEWELCQRMKIHYINAPFFSELKSKNAIFMINHYLVWASYVHGSGLSLLLVLSNFAGYIYYYIGDDNMDPQFWNNDFIFITMRIERLDCNPYMRTMTCDASDLFSWVSRACSIGSKALV